MGAEVCRPAQNNKQNSDELDIQSRKGCFQACYKKQKPENKENDSKIKPIQFSDLGSDRIQTKKQIQGDHEVKIKMPPQTQIQSNQFLGNQENSTNSNIKQNLTSFRKNNQGKEKSNNKIQLVIVNEERSGRLECIEGENNYEPLNVPYSVIKLMIKPEIFKQIKNIEKVDFDKVHGNPNSETFRTWKLQSKGFYTNRISDGRTIIITQKQFYLGHIKNQTYVPEDRGLLVTQYGYYKGNFKDGKAHGKGTFSTANGSKQCQGTWKFGCLQKGKFQTEQYKYNGDFENNIPHGTGTLQIKQNKVKYIGVFINGLFDDQNAFYECQKYTYKGQFKKGKKNGKGQLIQNEKSINKNIKIQQKTARKFKGEWKDDIFQRPQLNDS